MSMSSPSSSSSSPLSLTATVIVQETLAALRPRAGYLAQALDNRALHVILAQSHSTNASSHRQTDTLLLALGFGKLQCDWECFVSEDKSHPVAKELLKAILQRVQEPDLPHAVGTACFRALRAARITMRTTNSYKSNVRRSLRKKLVAASTRLVSRTLARAERKLSMRSARRVLAAVTEAATCARGFDCHIDVPTLTAAVISVFKVSTKVDWPCFWTLTRVVRALKALASVDCAEDSGTIISVLSPAGLGVVTAAFDHLFDILRICVDAHYDTDDDEPTDTDSNSDADTNTDTDTDPDTDTDTDTDSDSDSDSERNMALDSDGEDFRSDISDDTDYQIWQTEDEREKGVITSQKKRGCDAKDETNNRHGRFELAEDVCWLFARVFRQLPKVQSRAYAFGIAKPLTAMLQWGRGVSALRALQVIEQFGREVVKNGHILDAIRNCAHDADVVAAGWRILEKLLALGSNRGSATPWQAFLDHKDGIELALAANKIGLLATLAERRDLKVATVCAAKGIEDALLTLHALAQRDVLSPKDVALATDLCRLLCHIERGVSYRADVFAITALLRRHGAASLTLTQTGLRALDMIGARVESVIALMSNPETVSVLAALLAAHGLAIARQISTLLTKLAA